MFKNNPKGITESYPVIPAKVEQVVRSVKWSKGFDELVNQYCHENERTRNWMIKKAVGAMLGVAHLIPNSPEEDTGE
jgi:hypothetical protein